MTCLRRRSGCPLQDRGEHIDELHGRGNRGSGLARLRQLHDQRNLQRLAIEKEAVLLLAVLAEAFAMVGKQDDQGFIVDALALQIVDEITDDAIGVGDLAIVMIPVGAEVWLGRSVGSVRVVEVEEKEEGLARLSVEPFLRRLQRLVTISLYAADGRVAFERLDIVVEEIEAAGNARFASQNERRNGGPCCVAVFLEQLLKRRDRIGKPVADVVADAVIGGEHTR